MTETKTLPGEADKPRTGFRLHVASVALAVVSLLGHLGVGYARGRYGDHGMAFAMGYGFGQFIGVALFALLLGWIAYRLFDRSALAGNFTFCLIVVLGNWYEVAQRPG
jgi:hypothetical protein